jgi:hypothetical protein
MKRSITFKIAKLGAGALALSACGEIVYLLRRCPFRRCPDRTFSATLRRAERGISRAAGEGSSRG